MNLNELSKQFHEKAKSKGFWDVKRETGTLLMLVVSELSEALEADRKGRFADLMLFDKERQSSPFHEISATKEAFEIHIKDTFEDEIADVFIRMFDLVGHLNIDIEKHIELKMLYNATRPHKHGKSY